MVSESVKLITNALTEKTLERCQLLINEWCDLLGKNLVLGQLLDLKTESAAYFNVPITSDNFNELLIKYKTCSLFSFAFLLGALYTGKDFDTDDFKAMGLHFGMLFQLVDDYKDTATDDKRVNYILKHGICRTKDKIPRISQYNFLSCSKNTISIHPTFIQLIEKLDSHIPNLFSKKQQQQPLIN